jgi:hypothetical protein
MDIPNTELAEIAISIFTFLGAVLIMLFKTAIDELRILHESIDEVSSHLSHAKADIFKIAATVAACKACPHPRFEGLVSTEEEKG